MLSKYHKPYPSLEDIDERADEIIEICRDINNIKAVYSDISRIVNEQGENIDHIDLTIEESKNTVKKATDELKKASEYQNANPLSKILLITSSTIIGTAIGGPIGALVGLKAGCIATAITGAVAGGYAGKTYHEQTYKDIDD